MPHVVYHLKKEYLFYNINMFLTDDITQAARKGPIQAPLEFHHCSLHETSEEGHGHFAYVKKDDFLIKITQFLFFGTYK